MALALLLLGLSGVVSAQTMDRCRGNYIRTEIRKTEEQETFDCGLARNRQALPALQITRQIRYVYHEVKLYETLERTDRAPDQKIGKSFIDFEYRLLPGEIWPGEPETREELKEMGGFANETFFINGKRCQTNSAGLIFDNRETGLELLEYFDRLSHRRLSLEVLHPKLGSRTLQIYRIMPRRQRSDERNLDETPERDLLVAMELDFFQRTSEPERRKLLVEISSTSGPIVSGQPFTLSVTVSNGGQVDTSCLIGRTFSRDAWLHGRLFYFGAIAPGKAQTFTRTFTPTADLQTEQCFVQFSFSDSWGELPLFDRVLRLSAASLPATVMP